MEETAVRLSEGQDPFIGRVLLDRYRIIRILGRGGMGVVYLAEHVLIRRMVAVKILHPQLTASGELVQRFQREAQAAAAIGNEHIVDVTDMGQLDDGTLFIVLEYLDGVDLYTHVGQHGPLPLPRAAAIVAQICDALEAVHAAGIVHRDLKPENIFLIERNGRPEYVKVLDFGICKFLTDRPLTATGVALGTPRFMSPEQLEARPEIDHRADIYAVGAILFFALTGQGPFEATSLPRLLVSIWTDPAPRLRSLLPDAPPELDAIVARALEKNPNARYANSAELKAALAPFTPPRTSVGSGVAPTRDRDWALSSGIRDSLPLAPTSAAVSRFRIRCARRSTLAGVLAVLGLSAWWMASRDPSPLPHLGDRPHEDSTDVPDRPNPAPPADTRAPQRASTPTAPPAEPTLVPETMQSAPETSRGANPAHGRPALRRQRPTEMLQPSASSNRVSSEPAEPEPPVIAPTEPARPPPSAAAAESSGPPARAGIEPFLPSPRGLKPLN